MNVVLLAVIAVFAFHLVWGYRKGFLITVYSMVSWIVAVVFVSWATPYVTSFLIENTSLKEQISAYTAEQFHEMVSSDKDTETEEPKDAEDSEKKEEDIPEEDGQKVGMTDEKTLRELGLQLPRSLEDQVGDVGQMTNRFLEESGVYEEMSDNFSYMIVYGISFLVMLVLTRVLLKVLEYILKIISKIPVIHFANQTLGVIAGGVKGLLLIWLCFAIVALVVTSDFGQYMISYIYKEDILIWLYENNLILTLIMAFF